MKKILATIISVAISTSAFGIMNVQADEEMFNLPYGTGCYIETPEEFAANTGSNVDSGISIDSSRASMAALPSMVDNSTEKFFHLFEHKEVLALALDGQPHTISLHMK